MRRREFIALLGGAGPKKPAILVGAAILCFAIVQAEAAEIHDGDTGYIANNSIWFTDEPDLAVWKRVRQAFAPKDVKTYQRIILKERQRGNSFRDRPRSRLLAIGLTSTKSK